MNEDVADLEGIPLYCIPDTKVKSKPRVTRKELDAYAEAVQKDAEKVCDAIVNVLLKHGFEASTSCSMGHWLVTVDSKPKAGANDDDEEEDREAAFVSPTTDPQLRRIFNIRIKSQDVKPIINALTEVFGHTRTVAGKALKVETVEVIPLGYQLAVRYV